MSENDDSYRKIIEADQLSKSYGKQQVLKDISFTLSQGQILGLIGPNGAGKTTLLKAILGLANCQGQLTVLGKDPQKQRTELLNDVCFIADTATLPRWMTVNQLIQYMSGVHPRFNPNKAKDLVEKTTIKNTRKVSELSKGMITQLQLALIMAIDAKLLVLDEPTLGLDILSRKSFYNHLLNDYFDRTRTIIITTHQVEEIESLLTDVAFINKGELILNTEMKSIAKRYVQISLEESRYEAACALEPLAITKTTNGYQAIFNHDQQSDIESLGQCGVPSLADIFVLLVGDPSQ